MPEDCFSAGLAFGAKLVEAKNEIEIAVDLDKVTNLVGEMIDIVYKNEECFYDQLELGTVISVLKNIRQNVASKAVNLMTAHNDLEEMYNNLTY